MYDQNLSYKINKLLSENPQKAFKLKDVSRILKVSRHKHKDLRDTLFAMHREKRIDLKNRNYSALKEERGKKVRKEVFSQRKNPDKQLIGTFDATSLARNKSYAFVISEKMDVFVSAEDTLTAYHQDKVQVELRSSRNGKIFGIITKILKRAREKVVGNLQEYHGKFYLIPDNSKLHTNFIINKGTGTYEDFISLTQDIIHAVYNKFNIKLEYEIEIIS